MGLFFKKKIDWTKYTRQEESKVEQPKPTGRYPYRGEVTRKSGYSSFADYSVHATIRSDEAGDCIMDYEAMQICLLQDLRDQLGSLNKKLDTLVEALNNNIE